MYQKEEIERLAKKYVETQEEEVFEALIKALIPLINVQLGKNYSSLKEFWDDLRQEVLLKLWKNRGGLSKSNNISLFTHYYQRIRGGLFRGVEGLKGIRKKEKTKMGYDNLNPYVMYFPDVPEPYYSQLGLNDEPWGYRENGNKYKINSWIEIRGLGYVDLNEIIRNSEEYAIWREDILEKDDFKSVLSDKINWLIVHHLKAFNLLINECYDLGMTIDNWRSEKFFTVLFNKNNGTILTKFEHDEFHGMYGRGNNTSRQFIEFINYLTNKKYVSKRKGRTISEKIRRNSQRRSFRSINKDVNSVN